MDWYILFLASKLNFLVTINIFVPLHCRYRHCQWRWTHSMQPPQPYASKVIVYISAKPFSCFAQNNNQPLCSHCFQCPYPKTSSCTAVVMEQTPLTLQKCPHWHTCFKQCRNRSALTRQEPRKQGRDDRSIKTVQYTTPPFHIANIYTEVYMPSSVLCFTALCRSAIPTSRYTFNVSLVLFMSLF